MQKLSKLMSYFSMQSSNWLLAIMAGALLALMIDFNSLMAKHSTPLFAAWIAHGVGTLVSIFFVLTLARSTTAARVCQNEKSIKAPIWSYFGGIPGALTVVLAAITVNSTLGLAGSLALMLVGQVFFGLVADVFGLFDHPKRLVVMKDFLVILCVLLGSALIIFYRG